MAPLVWRLWLDYYAYFVRSSAEIAVLASRLICAIPSASTFLGMPGDHSSEFRQRIMMFIRNVNHIVALWKLRKDSICDQEGFVGWRDKLQIQAAQTMSGWIVKLTGADTWSGVGGRPRLSKRRLIGFLMANTEAWLPEACSRFSSQTGNRCCFTCSQCLFDSWKKTSLVTPVANRL